MKQITAVIKRGKLDDVVRAVTGAGARGMTVTEVRGFGEQCGQHGAVRLAEHQAAMLLPKIRADIVVRDVDAQAVVGAIAKSANTGAIGDGKIWVTRVDSVLRVRTGERDDAAL